MTWLFILPIGAALLLGSYALYRMVADVPLEDRSYLDRPPSGFRLLWPWIQFVAHYAGRMLSPSGRTNLHAKLRKAGVDYMVSAEQFVAGRVTAFLIAIGSGAMVMLMLHAEWDLNNVLMLMALAVIGSLYPNLWLHEVTLQREKQIFKSLPFYLDLITLSVEAGTNLTGAFSQAVQRAPEGPLKSEFSRLLRDVRAGKSRAEAMRALADRVQMEPVTSFVSSMIQAERMGASLGKVLRAQADQRRSERFLRAEKQAMEAPVKLLGPLIMFIFPTTFMVLSYVLVYKAVEAGVVSWKPLLWAMTWPGS